MTDNGVIVNVSSQSATAFRLAGALLSATKFAVHAMSEALRKELKAAGSSCSGRHSRPRFRGYSHS